MGQGNRATIQNIAGRLGVSKSTVSRALSDSPGVSVHPATREKVRELAAALGYRPHLMARAMSVRKTGVLGLLTYAVFDPIHAEYVQCFTSEVPGNGFQIMLGMATAIRSKDILDDQQFQIRQMISWGVDGILIHTRGREEESEAIVDAVGNLVPAVAFSTPIDGMCNVVVDRGAGVCAAVKHLAGLGHRRVGLVKVPWALAPAWDGYCRGIEECGLNPEVIDLDDSTIDGGYRCGARMVQSGEWPSAAICWGDMPAIGVCRAFLQAGLKVPDEIAVVGFGGMPITEYVTPPLTTIEQPLPEICRNAFRLLMDQLGGETQVKQVVIEPKLTVRESCGALPDYRDPESVSHREIVLESEDMKRPPATDLAEGGWRPSGTYKED